MRIIDVAIDPRAGGRDAHYTYANDSDYALGEAVMVPLGTRTVMGYVVETREIDPSTLAYKIKAPLNRVDGLSLPAHLIHLSHRISQLYFCPVPSALVPAIPPGTRDRLMSAWTALDTAREDLTALQKEVLLSLKDLGGEVIEAKGKPIEGKMLRTLRVLKQKGLVSHELRVATSEGKGLSAKEYRLSSNDQKIERFMASEARKKPAQCLAIMRLQEASSLAFSSAEIRALTGCADTTIRSMAKSGLLEETDGETRTQSPVHRANPEQARAISALCTAVKSKQATSFLLFGVTGSGKTEVFLQACAEALKIGRQVLYLVPEIALATQAIGQLHARFGRAVGILHSELGLTERLDNWIGIRSGKISVVLGARSAVFAPLDNIGLIVIDEEHEGSYKQESEPRYHTKTLGLELAKLHQCPIVLGSATPSLETYSEALRGDHVKLELTKRTANAQLPPVEIINLAEVFAQGTPSLFSPQLKNALIKTLAAKEQAILFINRRAFAPFIICRDCGFQTKCPHCSVSLSFHKRENRLRCHHCDFRAAVPVVCPQCGGERLRPFGVGTEKVEATLREEFPEARVARLDRDVTQKKGALESILTGVRTGDIDILVGTQMVAKGLDFPNVTLVGAVAADTALNVPDFRAAERCFQLLSQVAGRAGRGQKPGRVFIQTFNPTHPAIVCAKHHDYPQFYQQSIPEREGLGYPPFKRLINIVCSGPDRSQVIRVSELIAEQILQSVSSAKVELLGPADCALERLSGKWRRHMLIKADHELRLPKLEHDSEVLVIVDADAYNLS